MDHAKTPSNEGGRTSNFQRGRNWQRSCQLAFAAIRVDPWAKRGIGLSEAVDGLTSFRLKDKLM